MCAYAYVYRYTCVYVYLHIISMNIYLTFSFCVYFGLFFPVFSNGMDESIRYRQSGNKQKHTNFAHIDVV